jgi:hypothetical protein
VPHGQEPDNSFSRYCFDEGMLWSIIEEVIGANADFQQLEAA